MSQRKDFLATRRVAIKAGLSAALGALAAWTGLGTRSAMAQEKIAQEQVQYQDNPKDGAQCSGCVNFVAPNACTIVAGQIKASGWCVAYAPKGS